MWEIMTWLSWGNAAKTDALDDCQSDMGGGGCPFLDNGFLASAERTMPTMEAGQFLRYLRLMREKKIQTTNNSGEYAVPSVLIKCSPSSRDGLMHMTKASSCFLDESLWLWQHGCTPWSRTIPWWDWKGETNAKRQDPQIKCRSHTRGSHRLYPLHDSNKNLLTFVQCF